MPIIADIKSYQSGPIHIIEIIAEDGAVGLGQSGAWGLTSGVDAILPFARNYLIGKKVHNIEQHSQALYRQTPFKGSVLSGLVSAVDMALWDLHSKSLGVPLWYLLGGKTRERIRLCLLLNCTSAEQIHKDVADAISRGYTAIKFDPLAPGYESLTNVGLMYDVMENARAAREAAGSAADLVIELGRKLDPMLSRSLIELLAEVKPLFIEDPIQIDSISQQALLARDSSQPLAYGERLNTVWEFQELLAAGGPQYLRPDLGLAGGISGVKKIAAIAESFHAQLSPHNFLGPLMTAATLNLDSVIQNFSVQEYLELDEDTSFHPAIESSIRREGGYAYLSEDPGFGVKFKPDLFQMSGYEKFLAHQSPTLRLDGSIAAAV